MLAVGSERGMLLRDGGASARRAAAPPREEGRALRTVAAMRT
jgi:hypothetical protein